MCQQESTTSNADRQGQHGVMEANGALLARIQCVLWEGKEGIGFGYTDCELLAITYKINAQNPSFSLRVLLIYFFFFEG